MLILGQLSCANNDLYGLHKCSLNVGLDMLMEVKSLSRVQLFVMPWTIATRLLCPWDFPGKNTGVGLPFPSSGDLPDPGREPRSPTL